MTFGMASADRHHDQQRHAPCARAKEFRVPAVLTAVETESFSGYIWPQLLDIFPASQSSTQSMTPGRSGFPQSHGGHRPQEHPHDRPWTELHHWPTIECLAQL